MFKKFNSLKYKPETTREETLQPTKEPTIEIICRNHMQIKKSKKSYANAVSGANNLKYKKHIISRNTSNTNMANELQSILGTLEAQNSRKLQRHGKIPSRSNSKTDQTFTSKHEQLKNSKVKYSN